MPEPYASIANIDASIQKKLSNVLEFRGADLRQKKMTESYHSSLDLAENAMALEVDCGTGDNSRYLWSFDHMESIAEINPSPVFIEKAKELSWNIPGLALSTGNTRSLDFEDESFEQVVFHTTLCHVHPLKKP